MSAVGLMCPHGVVWAMRCETCNALSEQSTLDLTALRAALDRLQSLQRHTMEALQGMKVERDQVAQQFSDLQAEAQAAIEQARVSEASAAAMRGALEQAQIDCEEQHDDGACTSPCTTCEAIAAALSPSSGASLLSRLREAEGRVQKLEPIIVELARIDYRVAPTDWVNALAPVMKQVRAIVPPAPETPAKWEDVATPSNSAVMALAELTAPAKEPK